MLRYRRLLYALMLLLAACGGPSSPAAPTASPMPTSTVVPTASSAPALPASPTSGFSSTLSPTIAASPALPSPTGSPIGVSQPTAQPATATPRPTLPSRPEAADVVQRAREDLARRLGVDIRTIEVISVVQEPVPIDVLRCRKPGKDPGPQPPAMVGATRIELRAEGREYTYYARGKLLISCDAP